MKRMAWLWILFLALVACGSNDQESFTESDEITAEFIGTAVGHVYKQGNTEMFFTPDKRLIMKKYVGCKTAILGEFIKVQQVQNTSGIILTYQETDIRHLDAVVTDEKCLQELADYRATLPKPQTMVFCGFSRSKLDASCGNEELNSLNWY